MAVDFSRFQLFRTYEDVVSFLLRAYAAHEVTAKAYSDAEDFCLSFLVTEETYSRSLWGNFICC